MLFQLLLMSIQAGEDVRQMVLSPFQLFLPNLEFFVPECIFVSPALMGSVHLLMAVARALLIAV